MAACRRGRRRAPDAQAFLQRAAAAEQACGLGAEPVCEGSDCVLLMEAPDLDRLLGWARMAWRSPRFVASAAARDLGVPPPWIPCGAALGALQADTLTVERPGEAELWCTGAGPTGKVPRDLCEAEAQRRFGRGGFTEPGLRRLSFAGGAPER